jgi:hypothetical protein
VHREPRTAPVDTATAAIASIASRPIGLVVRAIGSFKGGVGRVDFVLVDLSGEPLTNVLDRKDVEYAKPPKRVAEAWESSVALAPALPYRVFFHVYDPTGVNLVAYDRRDFTCESNEEKP